MNPLASEGCLYICSTPIGNLGDITIRALDVLRTVDWIAAEDTRHTLKLLRHYDIQKPLKSLHDHNELQQTPELVGRLAAGETGALVSDAGTPLLSDPGYLLVQQSLDAGVRVIPVPGASAVLAALVGAGLPVYPFYFGGFLPRKSGERRRTLQSLAPLDATLIFYEVPHRLRATLRDVAEEYPQRAVVVARELTKLHEEFVRGTTGEVSDYFERHAPRGECVILVGGPPANRTEGELDDGRIKSALAAAMATGRSKKEAIKDVASFLGVDRQRVYQIGTQINPNIRVDDEFDGSGVKHP